MSEVELHKGIIKKVDTKGLNVKDWIKQYVNKYAEENPDSYTAKHINDSDFSYEYEFLDITWGQNYFIFKDNLFRAYDNEYDSDDFIDIKKNADGTYSYTTQFYNGGTYLAEQLKEGLKSLE
jgi:hypothetical protein